MRGVAQPIDSATVPMGRPDPLADAEIMGAKLVAKTIA